MTGAAGRISCGGLISAFLRTSRVSGAGLLTEARGNAATDTTFVGIGETTFTVTGLSAWATVMTFDALASVAADVFIAEGFVAALAVAFAVLANLPGLIDFACAGGRALSVVALAGAFVLTRPAVGLAAFLAFFFAAMGQSFNPMHVQAVMLRGQSRQN